MEVLVLFDSKGGHTYKLAEAVVEGVEQVEGVKARVRFVKETTPLEVIRNNSEWSKFYDWKTANLKEATLDDMSECDGLVMGCPTRYGNVTPALSNFIESMGPLWVKGVLVGKPGGVFTSTGTMHGGQETTLISMMFPLTHLGYIIVPIGYSDPAVSHTLRGGTPYGASSVSGPDGSQWPDEMELCVARAHGRRVAEIAKKLKD